MKKVIVVGAGIGGLTAAYRLKKAGFEVLVLEQSNAVGGRMKTVDAKGFQIDVGAGILPGAYKDTKALLGELGLTHLMEDVKGNCLFLRNGEQHAIDMGSMARDMLTSNVVSFASKLKLSKLGLDFARQYKNLTFTNMGLAAASDTQSVAEYCAQHFDPEVAEYLLGPFVRTMYLHSPEKASITELMWCMKNLTGQSFSLKGGMEILPRALAKDLEIRFNASVSDVSESAMGVEIRGTCDDKGFSEKADYCYIASDAPTLDSIFGHALSHRQRQYLQNLDYCPDIVVTFCLDKAPDIDAILIQVPESTDAELAAIVLDHKKGEGRVPPGKGMVTCHFLETWGHRHMISSDDYIRNAAAASVSKIIPEVATHLSHTHIERWQRAATSATCGTFKALADFMADRNKKSRVSYGGDYMAVSSVNVSVAIADTMAQNLCVLAGK